MGNARNDWPLSIQNEDCGITMWRDEQTISDLWNIQTQNQSIPKQALAFMHTHALSCFVSHIGWRQRNLIPPLPPLPPSSENCSLVPSLILESLILLFQGTYQSRHPAPYTSFSITSSKKNLLGPSPEGQENCIPDCLHPIGNNSFGHWAFNSGVRECPRKFWV